MKNNLTFTGVVVDILPVQLITSKDGQKEYKKQEIILEEDDEQYPNSIVLEVFDKLEKLDGIAIGDTVEAVFNTKARAWEKDGRKGTMGSNSIWKLTRTSGGTNTPYVSQAEPFPVTAPPAAGSDDLPF